MSENKVYVIGIAGGTGCGKSKIVEKIIEHYPNDTAVLHMDNYYKEHHDMPFEERCKINFDDPASVDMDLIFEHIIKLKNWIDVESPVYDFIEHDRSDKTKVIKANKILIIDGLFALVDEKIHSMMDTKIYVAVDSDVRILRRLRRDVEERGRSVDSVITQYLQTVKPMHEKYIAPSKINANLLVPQGGFNQVAVNIIVDHIKPVIENKTDKMEFWDTEDTDVQLLKEMSEKYRKFYEYDHKEDK